MAAGLRRAFRQRRKEDNSRCFRCGTGGDRVSGGAELGRADRGSWEPDNLLGAGAASATGRQGAMGSRLCQAQGDPGRVDSAPTGLFDQNGGDDVDRRDSGGRGQGLWTRTPELRKRHSARCDAFRGRRTISGWTRLSRKADGSRYDVATRSARSAYGNNRKSRLLSPPPPI